MNKKQKQDNIRYQLAEGQAWTCPLSKVKFIERDGRVIDPTTNKAVSVDHCHDTGFIRGILIQKINWLIDQWDQNSYGELSRPSEITAYLVTPPAFQIIGNIQFTDYWK
jgi:hypothetical protein